MLVYQINTQLSIFYTGFCIAQTIPSSIGKFTLLQDLDFSNSHVAGTLPSNIGYLPYLTSLELTGSGITELPNSFGSLTALQYLYWSLGGLTGTLFIRNFCLLIMLLCNKIGSLPYAFNNLTNLLHLDLKNTLINSGTKQDNCLLL